MYRIATLQDLRQRLRLPNSDSSDDDALLRALQDASHLIESATQRRYCPSIETRLVSLDPKNPRELILPADLLELYALRDAGGALNVGAVRRWPRHGDLPASVLKLTGEARFRFPSGPVPAASVWGIWGWHDRWSAAWRASGDVVRDNPLSAFASDIHVDDTAAADRDGLRPRFHVGHLLRIENEYLRVIAIDTVKQRLTVLRGQQGSRAAAHAWGAKIETYRPALAIRDLCLRYAEMMLLSKDLLEQESPPLLQSMRRLTA